MKFTRLFKLSLAPTLLIYVVAIIFLISGRGLNLGVDFTGGNITTIQFGDVFDVDRVRAVAEDAGAEGVTVSVSGDSVVQNQALVRMKDSGDPDQESTIRAAIESGLAEAYPDAYIVSSERVGAVAGRDLVANAVTATLIASALMLLYIGIRFELVSGCMAVVMQLHDVLIAVSFMLIFNLQINSPFVAAMLTILGCSINNTIIVFDRIRENKRRIGTRNATYADIVDRSITETLARTINTTITTLATILILYLIGVTSIREFAIPIIVGLAAGAYSSVMLAGPAWALWMDTHKKADATKKSVKRTAQKAR